MKIIEEYSHKNGKQFILNHFPNELTEVYSVIQSINLEDHKIKISKEKTMNGKLLYDPISLNKSYKISFNKLGWEKYRHKLDFDNHNYREMDFVKNKLGVEVQFGKYAFMAYNVCAKMTIFHNLGIIEAGIEIVPMKIMSDQMSTGVSYFEQIKWDLEHRGIADIDIPVIIMGIYQ
ncbi:BglII/BstYI family type II restriction endonuclease [Fervidicoccus fontis]|uniref:Restriction endonuclease n=1 Tax=Fervidicoccus fontis TaxID=683846 RepID=A0A7C2ZD44_9CREN|nr:BglII/BstYI family type II restriction endonuclease [Fervidicoccus fontis]HEW63630.1 restriction endonuclease [Fervidicoccus fontis]